RRKFVVELTAFQTCFVGRLVPQLRTRYACVMLPGCVASAMPAPYPCHSTQFSPVLALSGTTMRHCRLTALLTCCQKGCFPTIPR
ncbi:hypothetical protein, partial [Bifidobacterium callitrichos]|uniref:hypothetical protein n=1 Tax=Bifidobacterium callitrichos TaxID=762209 RepID=UPI001C62A59E